jgi:hypothetical protein
MSKAIVTDGVVLPHKPPKDHSYHVEDFNRKFLAVWLLHPDKYTYTSDRVRTIWGFIDKKTKAIYAPVNSKTPGTIIHPKETTKWSAMHPPKLNPLLQLLSL